MTPIVVLFSAKFAADNTCAMCSERQAAPQMNERSISVWDHSTEKDCKHLSTCATLNIRPFRFVNEFQMEPFAKKNETVLPEFFL